MQGFIMEQLDTEKVTNILNSIMKYELSGVVRYTHYALMVSGRDRISLKQFFQDQATESLQHATQAGDLVTGLGGHPSLEISIIEESNKHSALDLLEESMKHEQAAIAIYEELLVASEGASIYIEEYAGEMIKTEEIHRIELNKMLKDFAD